MVKTRKMPGKLCGYFCLFLLLSTHLSFVNSIAVSVNSGSALADDRAQHKKENVFSTATESGASGGKSSSGFNAENEKKHAVAQDAGSYNKEDKDHVQHQDSGSNFGENFNQQKGGKK